MHQTLDNQKLTKGKQGEIKSASVLARPLHLLGP